MDYSDGGEGRGTQHARATSSSSRIRTKRGLVPGDHDHRGTLKLGKLLQSVLHPPLLLQHDSGYQPTPLPTVDNRRNALVLDPSEVEIPPPSPAPSDDSSVYSLLSPPSPTAYQALITSSSPEKTAKRLPFFPSSPNRRRERSEDYLSSPQDTFTKSTAKALFPRLKSALIPSGKQTRRMLRKKHRPEIPYEVTDEPLDGEEGELIEDEGCYIDVCVKSCIDILSMLPDEISISILLFVDFSDIVACLGVSHHWRRLASDGLIWRSFFYRAGFGIDYAVARKQATTPSTPLLEHQTVHPPLSMASLSYTQHLSYVLSHRGSLTSLGTYQSLDSPPAPSRRHSVNSIAPLSFDWMAMYRTRQEIERRWAGMEPHRTSMRGHMDAVYCVEWDGTKIVTGSRDRTIKVWSVKTGKCLGTLHGHEGSVLCLKFDATGFLASGSSDQRVMIWNIGVNKSRQFEWQHVGQLWGHTGGVLDLKIDEKWIVSCSKDTHIRVWDRASLQPFQTLSGHDGPVNAVGLQDDKVVSASGDGKIMLWDIPTGERLRTFEGHDRGLACIEFRGDLIISGSNDKKIKIWSASTGECVQTLTGHEQLVRALSFDPGTMRLVSASYDRSIKVWDLRGGPGAAKCVREFKNAHDSHIFDVKARVGRIVSASHDQKIVIMDFAPDLDTKLFA